MKENEQAHALYVQLDRLKVRRMEIPGQYAEASRQHYEARKDVKSAQQTLANQKGELELLISGEKVDGKAAFPNADARKAELARRIATDDEIAFFQEALDKAEAVAQNYSNTVNTLEQEAKAIDVAVSAISEQVKLLTFIHVNS